MVSETYVELSPFVLRFTRDEDDAKDLMQETILKVLRHAHSYQGGSSLKGWLYRIMRNTFINNNRKQIKRQAVSADIQLAYLSPVIEISYNSSESSFLNNDI